jgi:mannose-6-phosphate isomerase
MSKNDPFFEHFAQHPASADYRKGIKKEIQPVYKAVADESVRPWGHYNILFESDDCKVKQIKVYPGGKLSYQYHFKRNEVWAVVSGTGIFTLDGINTICGPGDTLVIPTLAKHMIENTGKEPLVFIEVQRGSYFGEDDIVRLKDIYGRN